MVMKEQEKKKERKIKNRGKVSIKRIYRENQEKYINSGKKQKDKENQDIRTMEQRTQTEQRKKVNRDSKKHRERKREQREKMNKENKKMKKGK